MRTVVKKLDYEKVIKLPEPNLKRPLKQPFFWRWLLKNLSKKELKSVKFTCNKIGMEKLSKDEPCFVIMNHSSFIDLKIAAVILYPRPYNIVCTSDGFVGKNWLMRHIGCIPTNKFVKDFVLVRNLKYAVEKLQSSILMFPEASYSFDGTATKLSGSLPKCLKILNVPVVMIKTYGAFARSPLYNNLQVRKVKVSADIKYLFSKDDIKNKSTEELNDILNKEFEFDNWKWQQENHIKIDEPFRADSLNRVLYKCPFCRTEGKMNGSGIELECKQCGAKWVLSEYGEMDNILPGKGDFLESPATSSPSVFTHVPDWFKWEREEVRKEIQAGKYKIEADVDIFMLVNTKAIYKVGSGHLTHTKDGFVLDGCNGLLHYRQSPRASHSLYSDYFWYEIGDMICIGDMKKLYYCFPKKSGDIVAKARIAAEELYKIYKQSDISFNKPNI